MKLNLMKAIMPAVLALTFASCSSYAEDVTTPTTKQIPTADYSYHHDELELMQSINDYRQEIGLEALQAIDYVSVKSQEHTEYMIQNNAINHDNFDERSQDIVNEVGASRVSENVAYNYSTANAALEAWLESTAHRDNIEGDYTHFGISIKVNPINGNKYYTNIFLKK